MNQVGWRLERQSWFLAEASKQLAGSLDYEATLRAVAQAAVPGLADWCAVDILTDDGSIRRLAVAFADPAQEALVTESSERYAPSPTAPRGVPQVLRTGRPALWSQIPEPSEPTGAESDDDAQLLRGLGMRSAIIVPLAARERTLGALTFAAKDQDQPYDDADFTLAEELASRCALAVDNARLYRQARQALELRDTFLAAVSHDLRNPLATISAQAQVLRRVVTRDDSPLAARLGTGLSRIEATVVRMNGMIDELVDVARLQLGQPLELRLQQLDLVALVRRKVGEYQHAAHGHILQVAAETELTGEWDAPRLERVLDNLLGNAIKYSPNGGVITVIVVGDEDDTGNWAVVSVRDPGVGIPAADLPHVFERFARARNVGEISGSGLGLAVSHQIVRQHGGSISVDSAEGSGSVFTVRLPRRPASI